ncbi:MAG TPA: GTP cyclohydrolase II RibA [Marmoricola sp.]|nr:GTP cyclohydrolase II RibA [Marmoricola sp.]
MTTCTLWEASDDRVRPRARARVPLRVGDREVPAVVHTFSGLPAGAEHLLVAVGPTPAVSDVPLVRVHSECLTGDVLGSVRCDCGPQLRESLDLLAETGGYLVYLRQEGRGIGLYAKLDAYVLQDEGLDTYAANRALGFADDLREYDVAAGMLQCLGIRTIDLLTGNPDKAARLTAAGVHIRRVVPTRRHETSHNAGYLAAKQRRGHVFAAAPDADPGTADRAGGRAAPAAQPAPASFSSLVRSAAARWALPRSST